MLARRLVRRAVVAVSLPLLSSGCLLNTKTTEGHALHHAPVVLSHEQGVALSLTVSSRLVHLGTLSVVPAPDPGYHLTGLLDLGDGRASYDVDGKPVVVFDGKHAYALRPHARPTDARPWIEVTVDRHLHDFLLDPASLPPSLAVLAIRPSLLVDALSGALTGSITKVGEEDLNGTPTTKYTCRFDLTQALLDATRHQYSQRDMDDIAKVLGILGISEDQLNPGAVWIDSTGAPRRIEINLRETPLPQSLILVRVVLDLTPQDQPDTIQVPSSSAVTVVPSLFQYLSPLSAGTA